MENKILTHYVKIHGESYPRKQAFIDAEKVVGFVGWIIYYPTWREDIQVQMKRILLSDFTSSLETDGLW